MKEIRFKWRLSLSLSLSEIYSIQKQHFEKSKYNDFLRPQNKEYKYLNTVPEPLFCGAPARSRCINLYRPQWQGKSNTQVVNEYQRNANCRFATKNGLITFCIAPRQYIRTRDNAHQLQTVNEKRILKYKTKILSETRNSVGNRNLMVLSPPFFLCDYDFSNFFTEY